MLAQSIGDEFEILIKISNILPVPLGTKILSKGELLSKEEEKNID